MEQIIVKKKNGSIYRLFRYDKVSGVTSAEQTCSLSGEDVLNISVTSAEPIEFEIDDTIDIFGRIYTLNILPSANKVNDRKFEYDIQFEGVQYDLMKVIYLDADAIGFTNGSTFVLMGNVQTFVELIIRNLPRRFGPDKFQLGEIPLDTEYQNISFQNENCLQVLQKICDTYETYFEFERLDNDNYKLHIRKPNKTLDDIFIYGRGKGLYSLQRNKANNKNIITRLFAYGSTKNLPINYRDGSLRLKMPAGSIFSEGQPYIEDPVAIEKYGVIESSIVYEDIFPNRTGTVSAINSSNTLQFFDASMNFNLFEVLNGTSTYLLPGVPAKVVFKTGNLAGYEFSLNSTNGYIHTEKKFTLLPYTDDTGFVYPSATDAAFQIQPGDQYTLVDIAMPASYIVAAEDALELTAGQYLYDNSKPRMQYGLNIDPNYIEAKAPDQNTIINYLWVGDYVKVKDTDLGINGTVQIQSFRRDILKHYKYDLTLGDEEVNDSRRTYRLKRKRRFLVDIDSIQDRISNSTLTRIRSLSSEAAYEILTPENIGGLLTQGW